jgi:hypothetical protein
METRLAWVETDLGPLAAELTDHSPWYWYAESCPCGLPRGDWGVHPRARPNQRPPDGDWRVWGELVGQGTGRTTPVHGSMVPRKVLAACELVLLARTSAANFLASIRWIGVR